MIRSAGHPPVAAFIFDLDGTLIDSEDNYFESDKLFMREFGIEFTAEARRDLVGLGTRDMLRWFRNRYGVTQDLEELIARKDQTYLEVARNRTTVFPKMLNLVRELRGRGMPLALASGSTPPVIREMLDHLAIASFFDAVVSAVDVPNGKPSPDVFIEAARRLRVGPECCAVVEDSRHGVEAALRAGMRCVAVPTAVGDALHPVFYDAHLLFERGMPDFQARSVLRWLDGSAIKPARREGRHRPLHPPPTSPPCRRAW